MPLRTQNSNLRNRHLRLEPLEDRRVLAAIVVGNNNDLVNGDTTSIAALEASPGPDGISIREAIEAANNTEGADEITFDFGHDGPEEILLTLGELQITDELTITGDGPELLTIDAQQQSRVFLIEGTGEFSIAKTTLTNGLATDDDKGGGAIYSSLGNLTLSEVIANHNHTTGENGHGGAVNAANLTLLGTTISGNWTEGAAANGGGVLSTAVLISSDSRIVDNHTIGFSASGGGLAAGSAQITRTIVAGNHTQGHLAYGGGMLGLPNGDFTLINTTVSENWTLGFAASGGALHVVSDELDVVQSTITANWTEGVQTYAGLSTGITQVTIHGSLLTKNYGRGFESNIPSTGTRDWIVNFSIITGFHGVPEDIGEGNLFDVDPRLGPLADHGGPTMTHALLPGSPAIAAGDPSIVFDPNEFDQRGEGFFRVANGGNSLRIDIGAYESQGIPDYPVGDYNHDGIANLADYTKWRDTLGSTTDLAADGDGDEVIGPGDYDVWKQRFGNTTIPLNSPAASLETMELAFAFYQAPEPTAAKLRAEVGYMECTNAESLKRDGAFDAPYALDAASTHSIAAAKHASAASPPSPHLLSGPTLAIAWDDLADS